jgi:hypothetical protein
LAAAFAHMGTYESKGTEAPIRRASIHALEWVLLPHRMNAYGAYDMATGPTWYLIDDKERGWYLHYVWNSRLTGGVSRITHRKSALKRKRSKVTSQRWARKLHQLGLVEKTNLPDEKHGGLAPNQYRPLDPSYADGPQGDALAVVYGGKMRVLTAQQLQLPSVPDKTVAPEKPKPGLHGDKQQSAPAELPLPSVWGMAIAKLAGLYDRLELALLWAKYQQKKASNQVKNAAGYWRRMCDNRVKELAAAGMAQPQIRQQQVIPLRGRSADQERQDRRRYMVAQAALLLAQGQEPSHAVQQVLEMVYPAGLCVTSGPTIEEAMLAVQEARGPADELRAEFERRRQRLVVSDETQAWLRRQYADLRNRPMTKEERQLFGQQAITPARAAAILVNLPNRPGELKHASVEQLEKLLAELP